MDCNLQLIIQSIKSPPCPENVGKLSNLIKYCVWLSLLFICSCLLGTSLVHLSLLIEVSHWLLHRMQQRLNPGPLQILCSHTMLGNNITQ